LSAIFDLQHVLLDNDTTMAHNLETLNSNCTGRTFWAFLSSILAQIERRDEPAR